MKNYNISAKKRGDDIIFLRKIVPGGTDDSYGVEVAKLAGVPDTVVNRAKAILRELTQGKAPAPAARQETSAQEQMSLGSLAGEEVAEILRNTDINTITGLEALNLLNELKKKVEI